MTVPYLSEGDVRDLVSLSDVIDSLEYLLPRERDGEAINIPKSMAVWDARNSAHTLGGVDPANGLCAFKSWVNTPHGATSVLSLFDARNGALLAVMGANYLGSLRTAGVAGLATKVLAPEGADRLLICGTGRQALRQVEAVHTVRPVTAVTVWSPTEASRNRFAREVAETLGVATSVVSSPREAMADEIPLVTLVTRAHQPYFGAQLLGSHDVHINAMGAVLPGSAELSPEVVTAADVVAVDSLANARDSSRELVDALGPELTGVRTLGELLRKRPGAEAARRLTIFKAMGMGLSDLAAATTVARKAHLIGHVA